MSWITPTCLNTNSHVVSSLHNVILHRVRSTFRSVWLQPSCVGFFWRCWPWASQACLNEPHYFLRLIAREAYQLLCELHWLLTDVKAAHCHSSSQENQSVDVFQVTQRPLSQLNLPVLFILFPPVRFPLWLLHVCHTWSFFITQSNFICMVLYNNRKLPQVLHTKNMIESDTELHGIKNLPEVYEIDWMERQSKWVFSFHSVLIWQILYVEVRAIHVSHCHSLTEAHVSRKYRNTRAKIICRGQEIPAQGGCVGAAARVLAVCVTAEQMVSPQ